jgi:hypothetical protein
MKNSFWKDGLSIKETRFSIVGLLLVISCVYSLVYVALNKRLPAELLDLVKSLLLAFVGVNTVDRVSSAYESHNQSETDYKGGM